MQSRRAWQGVGINTSLPCLLADYHRGSIYCKLFSSCLRWNLAQDVSTQSTVCNCQLTDSVASPWVWRAWPSAHAASRSPAGHAPDRRGLSRARSRHPPCRPAADAGRWWRRVRQRQQRVCALIAALSFRAGSSQGVRLHSLSLAMSARKQHAQAQAGERHAHKQQPDAEYESRCQLRS